MAYRNGGSRLLLTDAAGLTSRQVATQAAAAGHTVDAVAPNRICLGTFTRHLRRIHLVPAFGRDPQAWLDAVLELLRAERYEVLVPTQEQVAILSRDSDRVRQLGTALAVPAFQSLRSVQDKIAQSITLRELSLPHPPTRVVQSADALLSDVRPPVYLKSPVGTASNAVRFIEDYAQLETSAAEMDLDDGVVVQQPLHGPLVMVQAVFDRGRLVCWHTNLRERAGSSGGASLKRSVHLPEISDHLRLLGDALGWHGALSMDAVITQSGPSYIDINPRLVEPGNAWRSGTDLVEALIDVSLGAAPQSCPPGDPNVRTHQALLAILGAAESSLGRRATIRELAQSIARRGPYSHSTEELTPTTGDPLAAAPLAAATIATLAYPPAWRWFATGAVSAYALTPAAWRQINQAAAL